jgi:hypothetical protein
MPLSNLVEAIAAQITTAVGNPPAVSTAPVLGVGDLPRVVVSVDAATPAMRSVGQVPGPVETGALRIEVSIDLADATLHLPGEDVVLISADRRTLQLPHGSVVRASGDDTAPFAASDLRVRVGATSFAPVHGTPTASQASLDIASGALTFRNPLPPTGTIELGYFVGTWEVHVERFAATAHLEIAAASQATLDQLVIDVEHALTVPRIEPAIGIRRIEPVALSSATSISGLPPAARRQRLSYQIDFERVEPIVPTSGGPIRRIDVTIQPPHPGDTFTITEASQP